MKKVILLSTFSLLALAGCTDLDDNSQPVYGKETGLPVNCRAYVQAAVDGFRKGIYTANEAMNGLERNCGLMGHAWKNMR